MFPINFHLKEFSPKTAQSCFRSLRLGSQSARRIFIRGLIRLSFEIDNLDSFVIIREPAAWMRSRKKLLEMVILKITRVIVRQADVDV